MASIKRKAPRTGDPISALIAAKLPDAATTAAASAGTSRQADRAQPQPPTQRDQRRLRPEHGAHRQRRQRREHTPGSAGGVGAPPGMNPSAASWPPVPGNLEMVRATRRPATPSIGSAHHTGIPPKPTRCGKSTYIQC